MNAHLVLCRQLNKYSSSPNMQYDYDIILTGGGGVLAALTAARIAKQGYREGDQLVVYTFGEPRIGDVDFASNFDSMIPLRYPTSMEPDSEYMECLGVPKGEDFACANKNKFYYRRPSSYLWDHRHYFPVRVAKYGQAGCDITQARNKVGTFDKLDIPLY
ncbi:unnamed protein product [Angiostrongylus costaricensis]|uniref:Lipase_3 domain-containing protein n=1 Tax=Angiostrongylus costaricensis TaxID=334426 RepID=A0A158PEC7_ANGCS|nr:unnamed protein product [Angiostrongylus costaricensis]